MSDFPRTPDRALWSDLKTEAGKRMMISLAALPVGPGSAIFGQEMRNYIKRIEEEAREQGRAEHLRKKGAA